MQALEQYRTSWSWHLVHLLFKGTDDLLHLEQLTAGMVNEQEFEGVDKGCGLSGLWLVKRWSKTADVVGVLKNCGL